MWRSLDDSSEGRRGDPGGVMRNIRLQQVPRRRGAERETSVLLLLSKPALLPAAVRERDGRASRYSSGEPRTPGVVTLEETPRCLYVCGCFSGSFEEFLRISALSPALCSPRDVCTLVVS